ncbi:MAG: hypothetical protein L6R39_007559, partial [Caloplaca ligustica]
RQQLVCAPSSEALPPKIKIFYREASSKLETQLSDIRETVLTTQHAVVAQTSAVASVLHYIASCAGPSSPFETSHGFFPEIYTITQRLPIFTLIVTDSYERISSAQCRENVYELFCLKSPRQWCRITLSLQIDCSSKYWTATKVLSGGLKKPGPADSFVVAHLPPSLLGKVQKCLSRLDVLGEDNDVSFNILDEEPIRTLEDLGCRRFIEDQVTQIQILDPPYRFASCVDGRLVYEVKNNSSIPNPDWVYNIRVLHCLDGVPGFAKLVGVVVDASERYLKSYLIEFPKAQWKLEQVTQYRLIPWVRREKWAKQLVQAVSDIHFRGLVIGAFYGSWSPVIIEGSDHIQFWNFKKTFEPTRKLRCYYPPEFLYLRGTSPTMRQAESPASTSKTDLFHLGLLLWLLVENVPLSCASPVCVKEGCNMEGDFCCNISHAEAVTLPDLPEDIPAYYKIMVQGCRAERPEDRPPARQLLSRFPTIHESGSTISASSTSEMTSARSDTDALGRGLVRMKRCSACGTTNIQFHFFHCNVCDAGHFDLYPGCYDKDMHCLDRDHLLLELKNDGISAVAGKYHSSPQATRGRKVLDL